MRRTDIKLIFLTALVAGLSLMLILSCSNPEAPVDSEPPTVTVTSPADGSIVPNTVDVVAEAADNVGVAKVEFYIDTELHHTDQSAPWSCYWTLAVEEAGEHTIFAKAFDAAGNWECSDLVTVNSTITPPAKITDLTASDPDLAGNVTLTWTAPGDDGNEGTAAEYDLRYYWTEITPDNWASAAPLDGEPAPQEAGSTETFDLTDLMLSREYFFAIRTKDASGNWSEVSDNAVVVTPDLFGGQLKYSVNDSPSDLAMADFNGDLHMDLAVSHQTDTNNVSILLNKGDGTFDDPVVYYGRWNPSALNAIDYDDDGDLDLAVANWDIGVQVEEPDGDTVTFEHSVMSLLANNGDGTFELVELAGRDTLGYIWCVYPPIYMPGFACVVYANDTQETPKNEYDILITDDWIDNYYAADNSDNVCAVDLNGDNLEDLAICNYGSHNISVLINNGDSTFADPVNYTGQNYPTAVRAGDLDGDGIVDLALSSLTASRVAILINNGDGTFQGEYHYDVGGAPTSLALLDCDGDGDLDIAAASRDDNLVSVLINDGTASFSAARSHMAGRGPAGIYCADFDGDSAPDMVVSNGYADDVSILLNAGIFMYYSYNTVNFEVGGDPAAVCAYDFDEDGDIDIAVLNEGSAEISILYNQSIH
ncbi:MAG: VCBS repeat-containing protein [Candidatus Zixiibacteriota bacterium]|nr:MAG: VCBS repeat-containing protein [candidate division Zixibacteria bacterium]